MKNFKEVIVPKTNWFSSVNQFLVTYKSAVKIAWSVDKKAFLTVTIMNSLNGILLYPSLLITKKLIDAVLLGITTNNINLATKMIAFYLFLDFLINISKAGFERFDWIFSDNLARYVSVAIQTRSLEKINSLSVRDAENPEVRNIFKKVFDLSGQRAWQLLMPVSYLPFVIFSIISATIPIVTFSPLIVIPALILAIPEVLVASKYSRKEYELTTKLAHSWRIWNAYEDFTSKGRYIYENKILGHVGEIIGRIKDLANNNFSQRFKLRYKYGKQRFFINIPLGVVNTAIRIWLYFQAVIGRITLGTAQMQFQAISQLVGNLSGLGRQINEIYENYLYVSDYNYFINLSEENLTEGGDVKLPLEYGIEFKNVWFKYPSSKRWILKGVSFKVEPRDNIAIIGKNGAGKTTIIKLLCKYYNPQKGEILVGGKNINDYASGSYRKIISALFQDFAQFPFSAKENIAFSDLKKYDDSKKLIKAAKLAGINEFINSLPKGYENALDIEFEGGIEPSKGQWQRLALARAFFRNAEIYILDEPTSNVDPQAEEEIFDEIISHAKEKIVMLVSHRFSTVRRADKIMVLEGGIVEEYGTHQKLMEKNSLYAKLFNLQAQAYLENNSILNTQK